MWPDQVRNKNHLLVCHPFISKQPALRFQEGPAAPANKLNASTLSSQYKYYMSGSFNNYQSTPVPWPVVRTRRQDKIKDLIVEDSFEANFVILFWPWAGSKPLIKDFYTEVDCIDRGNWPSHYKQLSRCSDKVERWNIFQYIQISSRPSDPEGIPHDLEVLEKSELWVQKSIPIHLTSWKNGMYFALQWTRCIEYFQFVSVWHSLNSLCSYNDNSRNTDMLIRLVLEELVLIERLMER